MTNSKIHFRVYGEGEPVVFLHGILGTHTQWIPFAKELTGYQLLLPDLPNHGDSVHISSMDYDEISCIMFEWISALGISNITLIGHSYGGKVAIKLANDYPELFKKLILIDSSNIKSDIPPTIELWIKAINQLEIESFSSYNEVRIYLREQGIPEKEAELLLKNIKREGKNFFWKSNMQVILDEISSVLSSVSVRNPIIVPMLLLRGEFSDYVSENNLAEIKKAFPLLKDIIIENAGHWVHVDNKEKFTRSILTFLEQ